MPKTIERPKARVNIEGLKFGRLTALHDIGKGKDGRRLWECLCECGKFVIAGVSQLKNGNTKSCGCLKSELASKRIKEHVIGYNRLPTGEANFNRVFHSYKNSARIRDLKFLLTKEQIKNLVTQDCFYCGVGPHAVMDDKRCNGGFVYNGIDRINNKKGYEITNCVTCCGTCNEWKRARTQQEFLLQVKFIYENLLRK